MLVNDFYTINSLKANEAGKVTAKVSFNAGHDIFKGHFPGMPVVPGVCLVKIVRELLEKQTRKAYQLRKADSIKFLQFVTPEQVKNLNFEMTVTPVENQLRVVNTAYFNGTIYFKFKGEYSEEPAGV